MAEVIDIVQNLIYNTDTSQLGKAGEELGKQLASISVLSTRLSRLNDLLQRTSTDDIAKRQRIIGLINQQKQAIDNQNKAISTTIQNNKQLQDAITKEIGLINLLDIRYKQLQEDKRKANSVDDIRRINQELAATEGQLKKLNTVGASGGGVFSSIKGGLLQGLGIGAGFGVAGLVASGVSALGSFLQESGQLAAEAEGVSRAFERLNRPGLLDNLREATKGTVSDLELMKQAIQFSNFGLPIDKLASALDFAKRRATETGQSIEYLVQSIVTGIARQSPLILDNLGLNVKRVRDEFQKTGNFAEAAFKIIQEESSKASVDLETFAEHQAKLNALLENQQVTIGTFYNQLKGFTIELLKDFTVDFGEYESNSNKYIDLLKKINQAKADQVHVNTQSDALYLQNFQDFTAKYVQSDFTGRDKVREQASKSYKTLSANAAEYYKNDARNLEIYLLGLRQAYQRFTQGLNTPVNLNTLTPAGVVGLSKEQLTSLQEQIDISRSALSRKDIDRINRLNALSAAIKKELDIINGTVKDEKAKKASYADLLQAAKENDEALRLLYLQEQANNNRLKAMYDADNASGVPASQEVRALREESYTREQRRINNLVEQRINEIERSFTKNKNKLTELKTKATQLQKEQSQNADILPDIATGRTASQAVGDFRPRTNFPELGDEDFQEKQQQKQLDRIANIKSAYLDLSQSIGQAFLTIYQTQAQLLDEQINRQTSRVEQAKLLLERGNVDAYNKEVERLDKLQQERERNAKAQVQINALLQASNAAVALTEAIGAIVGAAAKGDPYTIAARVAAAVAALVAGVAALKGAFSGGFHDGGYVGDGGEWEVAGHVHKGEYVMPKAKTQDPYNRRVLEAMYAGKPLPLASPAYSGGAGQSVNMRNVEKGLKRVEQAIESNQTIVKTDITGDSLRQLVERKQRANDRRWK